MPLNALKLIYCKFHIAQIIVLENIDNIIKGALEVFLSVHCFESAYLQYQQTIIYEWIAVRPDFFLTNL